MRPTRMLERLFSRNRLITMRRYVIGLSFVLAAFVIRYWLTPLLGEELPFMLFIAAALLAAWYGGAATGIIALLLGLFLADYFFIRRTPAPAYPAAGLLIFRYLFTASIGIVLIEVLHRARRRTERALADARREMELRKESELALLQAQEQLREHAQSLERHVEARTADLRATVASLEEVLYNIAHHLRAPPRAMGGFCEVLSEKYGPQLDATAQEYLRRISEASVRMDQLVHDLLEYGRLGHLEIAPRPVQLAEPINVALCKLAPQIESAQAEVSVESPLPTVLGHEALLENVFVKLIENAINFAKPETPPRIRISAESREQRVRVWVEDNGVGIDRRYHERIFGVFERLQVRSNGGTGIGLAIVKQAIQRLGGEAGVESEPGKGSRFWIELKAGGN